MLEVLDAVLRVVVKGGVDAVRYRAVADEAGVSLGTVSYHYSSREELLRAALTHYLEETARGLLALRDRSPARSLDDVADFVVEVVRRDFADKGRRVLAEYELMVFAARDPEVAAALERYESAMAAELARALERLGLRAPFAAARTIAEIIRGFELSGLGVARHDLEDLRARLKTLLSAYRGDSGPTRKGGTHVTRRSR